MLVTLLRNTGSNIIVFIVKLVIVFIMTPIFIYNLGNYDYGIWEVITTIVGYMGLLDIGIRPATSRFAALYNGKNDLVSLKKLYSTTLFYMACLGGILFLCMLIWAMFFSETLADSGIYEQKYSILLIIIGLQLLSAFPGQIAESFLEGFQKYELKNNIILFNSIVGASILYNLINPENALVLLATVHAFGVSVKYLIYIYLLSKPNLGGLSFDSKYISFETFKEIVTFGLKTFIQGVASRISAASDKLIIATFLGPAMVVFYSIPANLTERITTMRMMLTHAFMPFFSDLYSRNDLDTAREWFFSASRMVFGFICLLVFGVILLGHDFIRIWIGQEYADVGAIVLYLSCIPRLLNASNPFASRYLTALGRHGYLAKAMSIEAVLNISLSIVFVQWLGIYGVVVGTIIATLGIYPFILAYTCKHLNVDVTDYLKDCILPQLLPILAIIMTILLIKQHVYVAGYVELISIAVIGSIAFAVFFTFFSLQKKERTFLYSKIKSITNSKSLK